MTQGGNSMCCIPRQSFWVNTVMAAWEFSERILTGVSPNWNNVYFHWRHIPARRCWWISWWALKGGLYSGSFKLPCASGKQRGGMGSALGCCRWLRHGSSSSFREPKSRDVPLLPWLQPCFPSQGCGQSCPSGHSWHPAPPGRWEGGEWFHSFPSKPA